MTELSEVRYAHSGDIDIAYRVIGEGAPRIVFVSGFVSHLDLVWEIPGIASFCRRLGAIAPTIALDKRGTGLSDRTLGYGSVSDRMDDIRAVMDAAGVDRAAIHGVSEGGPLALLFAATYPDRARKLSLFGTFARLLKAPDYEFGADAEVMGSIPGQIRKFWGTGRVFRTFVPDAPEEALPTLARYERNACTPHMAEEIMRRNIEIDVRDVLPAINVPTLVLHYDADPIVSVEWGRYLGKEIAGARYVELPGALHASWDADWQFPEELVDFLGDGQAGAPPDLDRLLATVLFTDIVASTERTAALGDERWRRLLDDHDRIARAEVDRFRGRIVKTTGDGLLATFDGPTRGLGCAEAIRSGVRQLGLGVRAGVHTGEIERRGDDITGLGVVIARRICDLASSDEVLASRTVKELVAGSGIGFAERGIHALKGVPDDWPLYAVQP